MVGFPKVIKTKADLVNTYKLVKKGRLKKEDWLAAVEKLENQNFIFCPILEKTEDRKGVTLMFVNEVAEGDKVKAGNVTATVKSVGHIDENPSGCNAGKCKVCLSGFRRTDHRIHERFHQETSGIYAEASSGCHNNMRR